MTGRTESRPVALPNPQTNSHGEVHDCSKRMLGGPISFVLGSPSVL
jgi:hypothetical protein